MYLRIINVKNIPQTSSGKGKLFKSYSRFFSNLEVNMSRH